MADGLAVVAAGVPLKAAAEVAAAGLLGVLIEAALVSDDDADAEVDEDAAAALANFAAASWVACSFARALSK